MNATRLSIHLAIVTTIASVHVLAADRTETDVPPPANILATLRPNHPRVMARPETFDGIHSLVAKGGLPARLYADIRRSADQVLAGPVSKYEKPDGRRLLSVSRQVLDRVRTLALDERDPPRLCQGYSQS